MKYFNLFSNIWVTKGINRILISDLQRAISELYPLELYDVIQELKIYSIEDLLSNYDQDSQKIIEEYLDILLREEYGFITENSWDNNFPSLSHEYYEPSLLTELFIELEDITLLETIFPSIENLGIKHLIIYSQKKLTIENLIKIDGIFSTSVLCGIEIYSPFYEEINKSFIQNLNTQTGRIYNMIFYDCPKAPFKVKDEFRFMVHFVKEYLKISSCGKVDMEYFSTNLPKVLEAINHNSCLHKKIGIDIEGNIKNCPLMPEVYGNIYSSGLEEALRQPGFKKYWNLTKDYIEVCKDCEFRYVCTDCRAYTERTHTDQGLDSSKPLKCGYDPYTGNWKEWSKNPLKQKTINHYKL